MQISEFTKLYLQMPVSERGQVMFEIRGKGIFTYRNVYTSITHKPYDKETKLIIAHLKKL